MKIHLVADSIWREKPSGIIGQNYYGENRGQDFEVLEGPVSEDLYSEFVRGEHGWLALRIDGMVYGVLVE